MDSVPDGVWTCPACAGLSMPYTITRDWVTRLVSFVSEGAQLDDPGSGAVDARRERLGRVVLQLQHIRNRRVQFALRVDLLQALGRWVRPGASTGEEAIRVAILTQLTAIFDHVDFRLAKQSKVGAALVRCMNAPEEENSPRSRHLEDGILGKIQRLATQSLTQRPQLPAILVNHIRALSRARERGNGPQSRVKLAYGNAAGELDRTQASLPSTMKTLSSRDWSARDTKRLLLYGNTKEEVSAREDVSKRPRVISAALDAVIERDVQNVAELNPLKRAKVRELALKEFMNDGAHRDAFEAVIAVRSSVFDIDERKEPDVFVASILGKSSDQVSLNMKRIIQFVAWDV
ncbi:Hypothetical Protein FCC1311_010522 [Hondaea fermentalgiana]|uniref:Uncharacterized protein n=1 Tax=Hondaea fermentalgiana TaxID=2315210 RepID=A0A2R5GAW5_9STRA|nr:Hypothetical Protein FCC1311_010522 [Hondaea fermentalgiana]|eukprot:GBG24834.1 Hypothetical Protein FCC1311_010522 [Hondaea fermentalgiana]